MNVEEVTNFTMNMKANNNPVRTVSYGEDLNYSVNSIGMVVASGRTNDILRGLGMGELFCGFDDLTGKGVGISYGSGNEECEGGG